MQAQDLQPSQRFSVAEAPGHVFTLAEPIEHVGGVLLMKIKERPDTAMSLVPTHEVVLVED